MLVKMGIFPKKGGDNKNMFETTTQMSTLLHFGDVSLQNQSKVQVETKTRRPYDHFYWPQGSFANHWS